MTERKIRKLLRGKSPQQVEGSPNQEEATWVWAWWDTSCVDGDTVPVHMCVPSQLFVRLQKGLLGWEPMLRCYDGLTQAFRDLIQTTRVRR